MKKAVKPPQEILASRQHTFLAEPLEQRSLLSVSLINDVNTIPASTESSGLTDLNGTLFFASNDGIHGSELYKSNGTADSTSMVRDINTAPGLGSSPLVLTNIHGTLYFSAKSSLWKSDGTSSGTTPIQTTDGSIVPNPGEIFPGPGSSAYVVSYYNNALDIWTTDGTPAGTQKLVHSDPVVFSGAAGLNNKLYYLVTAGSSTQLWSIDSAAPTPVLITTIPRTSLNVMQVFDGKIFLGFNNSDGLWVTDGTAQGTSAVPNMGEVVFGATAGQTLFFVSYPSTGNPRLWAYRQNVFTSLLDVGSDAVFPVNNNAFFGMPDGIWTSDGTVAGTHRVDGFGGPGQISPSSLNSVGDQLFMTAPDPNTGLVDVYASDGTPQGTTFLKAFPANPNGTLPNSFTRSGNFVYFRSNDGVTGTEVWVTDGTSQNTHILKDIYPGTGAAAPKTLGVLKGRLYYYANDGIHGFEPWSTDGTPGGAALLKDIAPGSTNGMLAISGKTQTTSQYLFFTAHEVNLGPIELWRTDGTSDGTIKLANVSTAAASWGVINDTVYFIPDSDSNTVKGLWTSDGTPQGTHTVPGGAAITAISAVMDNVLYCVGSDTTYGQEIWRSDGTAGGTYRVTDINPGPASASPTNLAAVGHALLFFARYDATSTNNLFKYTVDVGLALVKDINPGANDSSTNNSFAVANGKYYFPSNGSATGSELWVSDGSADGTHLVKDIIPGSTGSSPQKLFAINDVLIFTATSAQFGPQKLYRSDGTDVGTYSLSDVLPSTVVSASIPNFTISGTYAYFRGTKSGNESVWRTDGTNGVSMVADMVTDLPALPSQMAGFKGNLYFTADDGVKGNEFWTYSPDDPPLAPPVVTFDPKTGLKVQFDRPLANDSVRTAFIAAMITKNSLIITGYASLSIDYPAGIVSVTFPGYPHGIPPTGNYAVLLPAGYVHDLLENPLPTDYRANFFIQAGDANQDRSVDFADLVAVAQNYGLSTNATYANGDFNGDGAVDFADLVTLAQNYGKTLAPPLASPVPTPPIAAPELLASAKSKPQNSKLTLFNTKAPIRPTKPPKPKQIITRR